MIALTVFAVTVWLAVAVQPDAVVTVTVYVLDELTEIDDVVAPVFQE